MPCRDFGCFGRSKYWIVKIRSSGSVRGCEEVFPSINRCTVRRFCPIGLTWRCSGFKGLKILTSTYVDVEILNVDINDKTWHEVSVYCTVFQTLRMLPYVLALSYRASVSVCHMDIERRSV
ncbi:hypothetical protein Taro_003111 [Colocasia esculenta]|uniref:Uncharacterized protein n=1 Tax=Colocasia esculenta TaxID=4460 RepID=A0A843TKS3_COLES|nr:hypothetical protein [Colocasia esculenta]